MHILKRPNKMLKTFLQENKIKFYTKEKKIKNLPITAT